MGLQQQQNGQFPLRDAPTRNYGSFIHHLGLDIWFYEYNDHDSLQAGLINRIAHLKTKRTGRQITSCPSSL